MAAGRSPVERNRVWEHDTLRQFAAVRCDLVILLLRLSKFGGLDACAASYVGHRVHDGIGAAQVARIVDQGIVDLHFVEPDIADVG